MMCPRRIVRSAETGTAAIETDVAGGTKRGTTSKLYIKEGRSERVNEKEMEIDYLARYDK
jgi:hypothetical protein